jgi:hypothetical protein
MCAKSALGVIGASQKRSRSVITPRCGERARSRLICGPRSDSVSACGSAQIGLICAPSGWLAGRGLRRARASRLRRLRSARARPTAEGPASPQLRASPPEPSWPGPSGADQDVEDHLIRRRDLPVAVAPGLFGQLKQGQAAPGGCAAGACQGRLMVQPQGRDRRSRSAPALGSSTCRARSPGSLGRGDRPTPPPRPAWRRSP